MRDTPQELSAADLAARAAMARAVSMWPYMTDKRRAELDTVLEKLEGAFTENCSAATKTAIAKSINNIRDNPT